MFSTLVLAAALAGSAASTILWDGRFDSTTLATVAECESLLYLPTSP